MPLTGLGAFLDELALFKILLCTKNKIQLEEQFLEKVIWEMVTDPAGYGYVLKSAPLILSAKYSFKFQFIFFSAVVAFISSGKSFNL